MKQATQGIADAANNLDTDYFRSVYWNDDQAILIDPSYGVVDYDTYKDATEEMYSGLEMINFIKDTIMVRVIDENTAYAVFKGSAKGEAKNGTKMGINDFYASMVSEKVDVQWKIAHTHESFKQEMMMPSTSDSTTVE
ncbi:nuclear transport factor 2 family protein [Psychroflexus aurantiacus]|uniref:nuclear transport factor 2 family protein n=1 Tax=Psychroflexus aurantiacus TaxID=2709310 RepID=UPI00293B8F80|nr:nuclear transport factor 2 family protein [Psychroflexus aurantiacus]